MALDAALELSVEQLIGASNKKIFMECTRVQLMTPFATCASVAALTAEVRSNELKWREPPRVDEIVFRSTAWKNERKTSYTK